jgi:hypothetical protein
MPHAPDTEPRLTRRTFLGVTLVIAAAPAACSSSTDGGAPAAGGPDRPKSIDGWAIPARAHLSPERYAALAAVMDALIPGDASSPGATLAGAAFYLDQLFGAFDVDPPRIFAGGPYSGRHGGADDFSHFQRLTRVEELRWRTAIEGSRGLPEREWNGPVKGLVVEYEEGLDALDAAAQDQQGARFSTLPLDVRRSLLLGADKAFVALVYTHAVEGTYGDPVYGGNAGGAGWRAIAYEGDRQPIGYTARQMAHPEEA